MILYIGMSQKIRLNGTGRFLLFVQKRKGKLNIRSITEIFVPPLFFGTVHSDIGIPYKGIFSNLTH